MTEPTQCPFCRSVNTEITNSTQPEWCNDNHGIVCEDWTCKDCNKCWSMRARIEAIHRDLDFCYVCPYCGEAEGITYQNSEKNAVWYWCRSCRREFAVHPQEWYDRLIE